MKAFAELYWALDSSTSNRAKLDALQRYFHAAAPDDAAWAVYFLAGGKPRQLVPTKILREAAREAADLPEWLFEESYQAVGDLAETISLVLPDPDTPVDRGLAEWMRKGLLPLRGLPPDDQKRRLREHWHALDRRERLPYLKLITGALRVGVSRLQVTQALAAVGRVEASLVAQRLMGYTRIGAAPTKADYLALIEMPPHPDLFDTQRGGAPYPFFLAHPLSEHFSRFDDALGAPGDWQIEWKWDGIRAQLVRRDDAVWIWSRGEELVTDRFPELVAMAETLPNGVVLDGEILIWCPPEDVEPANVDEDAAAARPGSPLMRGVRPFAELQKRIGRKTLGPRILRDHPVVFVAYDLLEHDGADMRARPLHERRATLETLREKHPHPALHLSPLVRGTTWDALAQQREAARELGTEGFMLKRCDSAYGVGRTKQAGIWWKWKIDPMSVDAVLIYAQRGHGRRASLYSDYTFAVWSGPPDDPTRTLVPFAKAYSGLTDDELRRVDAVVRKTVRESFGPVRSVEPTQVFELGFEGIARSSRHKSGIAVRFPRILRWRDDKPVAEADTIDTLNALLPGSHAR